MTNSARTKTLNGLQGDLLSGEWSSKPIRRSRGQHIRLKPLGDDQRVAVPGMADFCGGGPEGTYCRDCSHFADEIAVQTSGNTIEKAKAGCEVWAQRMGHAAPSPRRDIRLCPSCKHFGKVTDASFRCFVVDIVGISYPLKSMPEDLSAWLHSQSTGSTH